MRVVLKPLPVIYACQGCAQFGQQARELAERLERNGEGEVIWLGDARRAECTRRYPVVSVDGCEKGCALRWLAEHGITVDRAYLLPGCPR